MRRASLFPMLLFFPLSLLAAQYYAGRFHQGWVDTSLLIMMSETMIIRLIIFMMKKKIKTFPLKVKDMSSQVDLAMGLLSDYALVKPSGCKEICQSKITGDSA